MSVITQNGLKLHFRDEGSGPALLLLHAFPLCGEMYREQLNWLSRKYRVIVPDLRGFGQSDPGQGPTEMSTFAADALAVLDHLNIDAAVVGGVSMGGYAAMALLDLDPGRVKGLILADTQLGADDEAGRARREEVAQAVETKGMIAIVETLLPKLLAPSASPELQSRVRSMILENPPAGTAAASRGMGLRPNSKNILARFAGPALIVVGEHDVITPRAKADEMANVMSNARVVEIPDAGHLANLERPGAFNEAVEALMTQAG